MNRGYLRELREINKMTQNDVAEALKISRAGYTNLESGQRQRKMLDYLLMEKLAAAFGISVDEIIALEKKYQQSKAA